MTEFFSETKFYTVGKRKDGKIQLDGLDGISIIMKEKDLHILNSATKINNEEKVNQTELINIIMSNPKTAMSICFQKANKTKSQRAFNAEKAAKIEEFKKATLDTIEDLTIHLIDNPIVPYIPGDMRTIIGYHDNVIDERGRLSFVDIEDGNKLKLVDPRTTIYVIVNDIKYIKK